MKSQVFVVIILVAISFAVDSCLPPRPSAQGLHFAPETPVTKAAVDHAFQQYYWLTSKYPPGPPQLPARAQLEVEAPIAMYTLSTQDFLAGRGLQAVKCVKYIYYVKASGEIVGQVDVTPNPDGSFDEQASALSDISAFQRARLAPVFDALTRLKKMEKVRKGSFEVCFLNLPAYDRAQGGHAATGFVIWLKSDEPVGDLIYTIAPGKDYQPSPGLSPSTLYTVPQVFEAIRPAVAAFETADTTAPQHGR